MNESILRSIEKGAFMIKESKKRSEEIYVRIRLESGQLVKVNKSKEGSRKSFKEDEIVMVELSHIVDVRNSDQESLFHRKHEIQSNLSKGGVKSSMGRNASASFRFTIHHGLQFNLKTVSFRAINTGQYFDWVAGLKYLIDQGAEIPYESVVESWLWKHYYNIGESVTEEKIKGPVEIDDEFIIPISMQKRNSSSLSSLLDETDRSNQFDPQNKWIEERRLSNKDSRRKSEYSAFNNYTNAHQSKGEKRKSHTPNSLRHFRRYSWCSNISSILDSSSQRRFASPDCDTSNKSLKSYDVKISPKQLKVWLAQQNGTKIALDNIKDYNSNYPPKPNFIDFSGFVKIYKELLYQPETFIKIIKQRLRKLQNNLATTATENVKLDDLHLCTMDREWFQSIIDYRVDYDFQESDLDSLFNPSNSIWDPERGSKVYQDMDQPLSSYYISSSHNSYLTGDQITSKSSCEAYTRCIQMGCRSIELDCWNGDREPIIYHGNTLTSKIKLNDVLHTIRKCAWQKSNYPLILSIEDHCDIQLQIIMAQMMQEIFQEELLKDPVKFDDSSVNQLPSPNQLKNKIILKHKKLPIDSLSKSGSLNVLNEPAEEYNENILSNYLYSGRMYMKDLFLDTWTPYYFLLSQNRTLIYTEDTSANDSDCHFSQISFQKPSTQPKNINVDLQNVDNSARFVTIDHSEKLAINCNGCVPSELTNKTRLPNWFYGSLSRMEASNWLLRYWFLGDGTFLIRTSESFQGNYSLSFYRKDKIHHVRICRFFDKINHKTSLGFEHCDIQFLTMEDLVAHYQDNEMVALDFKIRLKHPPPERFQDKSWFYSDPPINSTSTEEILSKIPLVGSFLVRCKEEDYFPIESSMRMSLDQSRTVTEEHFTLSYKGRGNVVVHIAIGYDGFQYTILGQSSISLVELIDFFFKNRLSDGIKLKYPADSNLIRKCNMLSKIPPQYQCNKDGDNILNSPIGELRIKTDNSICPSATASDLLSLREDQEGELPAMNGHTVHDNNPHITQMTESPDRFKNHDNGYGDVINLGPLGNLEMGNFQLDSDCCVKQVNIDSDNVEPLMFPFDLYIVDFKIQLACETEHQRSGWIDAISHCLNGDVDHDMHLIHRKKEIQHKIAKPLSDLIIYCSSVPFSWPDNPKDFTRFLNSPCRDMSSVSENKFIKLISLKSNNMPPNVNSISCVAFLNDNGGNEISSSRLRDLIEYHKSHLTRIYPKATRLDSSNLSPTIPWLSGVQMVAINFQTPDRSLQLNQALFRDNGGCGYVLKDFSAFTPTQRLEVHLTFLGARHLPRINKGWLEIEMISLHDELYEKRTYPIKSEFRVIDVDIPDIHFCVKNLSLAFIRFAFGSEDQLNQKKRINSCQATFLIRGIRPGIRSVTFRNGFDYIHDLATLLFHVNLAIVEENKDQ